MYINLYWVEETQGMDKSHCKITSVELEMCWVKNPRCRNHKIPELISQVELRILHYKDKSPRIA